MIKTKGLVHFTIPVTDTQRAKDFYCRVLGMKLLHDTGARGMVFLDSGGDCVILAKTEKPISTAGERDIHHSFLV
ncbi:MAG TPA: VOC family protein, partial [Stellaceae bacterium]|nr:VOC family protein [Stellaceae bacterium]